MNLIQKHEQLGITDFQQIIGVVTDYFDGLYEADISKLSRIFDPLASLQAPNLRRTLQDWTNAVSSRDVPKNIDQAYRFKINSIEVVLNQAVVKVECPLFDYDYVDFLSLLKENGRWQIVNKMYTDTKGALNENT